MADEISAFTRWRPFWTCPRRCKQSQPIRWYATVIRSTHQEYWVRLTRAMQKPLRRFLVQPLREVVVAVVSVVFNGCFPVFPRSVGPVLFVQDVDMSKHCVTVRPHKFFIIHRNCVWVSGAHKFNFLTRVFFAFLSSYDTLEVFARWSIVNTHSQIFYLWRVTNKSLKH